MPVCQRVSESSQTPLVAIASRMSGQVLQKLSKRGEVPYVVWVGGAFGGVEGHLRFLVLRLESNLLASAVCLNRRLSNRRAKSTFVGL